jgi:hypothetical protein
MENFNDKIEQQILLINLANELFEGQEPEFDETEKKMMNETLKNTFDKSSSKEPPFDWMK